MVRRRDFVNFIYIDNPVLCPFKVTIRFLDQVTDQLFYVSPHITCLTELCGIALYERYAQFRRYELDKICLSNSGRTYEDYIILYASNRMGIFPLFLKICDLVKVSTYLCCQNGLCHILPDHIPVQVGLKLLRLEIKAYFWALLRISPFFLVDAIRLYLPRKGHLGHYPYSAPIPFGKIITYLLFQVFL